MDKPPFTWVTPIFCVNDLNASLAYYAEKLGFEVNWSWSEREGFEGTPEGVQPADPTFACVCRGEISLFLCEKGQGVPGAWLVCNVASPAEVDAVHAEYCESGAKIVEAPVDCPWGLRELLVEDLDGNRIRVGAVIEGA